MDSCPSEIPIGEGGGGMHFSENSRVGGKLVVIADLRGVLPRCIARFSESGIFTSWAPW